MVKYGDSKTYKYKLDDERLKWLVGKTNRAEHQTQFLFNLMDGDFERLKQLEIQLKNCLCFYCPENVEEAERVMNLIPVNNILQFEN